MGLSAYICELLHVTECLFRQKVEPYSGSVSLLSTALNEGCCKSIAGPQGSSRKGAKSIATVSVLLDTGWGSPRTRTGSAIPGRRWALSTELPSQLTYDSQRMQSKVSPGARRWVVKSRGPASSALSSGVAQDALNSPSREPRRRCAVVSSRDALESPRPRFLGGGWSHKHPLPDTHPPQARRRTAGAQCCPTVCTHRLGQGAACHSWG